MANITNNKAQIKKRHLENSVAEFIPYAVQINENTIKTHGGEYLQTIKINGIAHESADPEDVVIWKEQLNTLLKNIAAPNVALWTHVIRREENSYPASDFTSSFAKQLDKRYQAHLDKYKMMVNDLYITILYRPSTTKAQGLFQRFTQSLEKDRTALIQQQNDAIERLTETSTLMMSSLRHYGPHLLGTYQKDNQRYSEVLAFLSFLVNGQWDERALPRQDLSQTLAYNRIFFGADAFEIRGVVDSQVGAILAIKEYPESTEAGMLNALLSAPFPLILSQSFNFLSKPVSTELLSRQQRRMINAGDLAESQINAIDEALDQLTSSHIVFGEHHLNLCVLAKDAKELKNNLSAARGELADCAMIVAREDWALAAAFWAQLPGNFKYRTRPAPISSKNFVGFSSFHNYPIGSIANNPWGDAVTTFKTSSGAPYYFNFHDVTDSSEDKKGQTVLGNTVIIGPSGSGKTVVQGFLMAQSNKFNPTQVIFDKDRGLEIYVRAEGGVYLQLENGKPTGCNPFQLEPTENNLLFLESLIKKCAGDNLTIKDEHDITRAVRAVMLGPLPKQERKLSACLPFFDATDMNGVGARLKKWCGNGSLAWVFDNDEDSISFEHNTLFGFDVTDFLDNAQIRTPIIMYLFHRIEELIDGRRLMIFMDEFWKLLGDEYFQDFAQNKLKVIRKQNGILVLGTQSAGEVINSPIAHSIIEQCATMIFMPNPKGSHQDYVEGFKLTKREFALIKEELQPNSRCFLVKQGHSSVVAELDLKGLDDELAVISGTTKNVHLVNEIISSLGEFPENWVDEFHRRRKMN